MYHGVSLDEVIAELPEEKASYDEPHKAMYQLLKKRHVAPQFGGHTRVAPEERDYLVIEDVPDVFHTGHVHKLGWGSTTTCSPSTPVAGKRRPTSRSPSTSIPTPATRPSSTWTLST